MKTKKITLLSHALAAKTPLYGGADRIKLIQQKSLNNGDSCNKMLWQFPNHAGTHIDAPLHFLKKGKSIADYAPGSWIFNKVSLIMMAKIKPDQIIKSSDIGISKDCELFLIKTGFEKYRRTDTYWKNSPGIHPEVAVFLKKQMPSLKAIGVDFISISSLADRKLGREAHRSFLSKNILLIEDMRLSALKGGLETVIVSPLLVEGADGSPCTVFGIGN